MTSIDRKTLNKAREWAEGTKKLTLAPKTQAAVDIIQSMPDKWVDADTLREFISEWRTDCPAGDGYKILDQLESLLPTPTPRTMAEMTPEERNACQWMQVEVSGVDEELGAIIRVAKHHAEVLWPDGLTTLPDHQVLTPRPDLPKMEWPGSAENSEDTATEPATPRPEDVPVGEPWQVEAEGKEFIGYRNSPGSSFPWAIIKGDEPVSHYCIDTEVTLIARLVPETTEQDTETVFDPAYTYRDKDGEDWSHVAGGWHWGGGAISRPLSAPPAKCGPYTRIKDTNE